MSLTLLKHAGAASADAELAARIAHGDGEALQVLMRRCNQTLYRTARSILRNDADAEDAVQEAYFKAYRVMGTFRGDASLATWLVRIVINESKQRLRQRERRLRPVAFDDLRAAGPDLPENSMYEAASGPLPEQIVLQAQTRRLLESRIDQLPDTFRTVFMLRAVEEMTVEEVADCLDIPCATVRTRYFRARALLRKALERDMAAGLGGAFSFAGDRCDRIVAAVMARLGPGAGHR
ncbi:RNA polymerase sigma factor [Bordetella petrii]|uniref:RNA polymerase sigma factor n=1 Tax=Bordetella petrii TaxID=94624 RepID=UPI001A97782B|nr:RNA polymerase sigma factor [Bordetella petrii]MBO1111220.1 RNA polymerase sigma factor [Bordetella petrii]